MTTGLRKWYASPITMTAGLYDDMHDQVNRQGPSQTLSRVSWFQRANAVISTVSQYCYTQPILEAFENVTNERAHTRHPFLTPRANTKSWGDRLSPYDGSVQIINGLAPFELSHPRATEVHRPTHPIAPSPAGPSFQHASHTAGQTNPSITSWLTPCVFRLLHCARQPFAKGRT